MPVISNNILKQPIPAPGTIPPGSFSSHLILGRPGHVYLAGYNALSSQISILHDLPFPGCPSWLALDPRSRNTLYVVDEDGTTFHRFHFKTPSVTDDSGKLSPFTDHYVAQGASPGLVYLAFHHDATKLLASAFANGTIDIWDISGDSLKLYAPSDKTVANPIVAGGKTGPISDIQDAPHPHQIIADPTGRFYVVPDLGTDELLLIDSRDDSFKIVNRVYVGAGAGPRHGGFYPVPTNTAPQQATHFILLCELSSTLIVYALSYTDTGIDFDFISSTSSFGPDGPPVKSESVRPRAGAFQITPDNKHVYITNRLTGLDTDSLVHFQITFDEDATNTHPVLEFGNLVSTGGTLPRHFCILDNGKGDVLVANESGELGLVVFNRDRQTGRLTEEPKCAMKNAELVTAEEKEESSSGGVKFVLQV